MLKRLSFLLVILMLISYSAKAEVKSISTGKLFLNSCEDIIEAGKGRDIDEVMQGSFCLGYINGMAQMTPTKDIVGMSIKDIALDYILYLRLHKEDQNLNNDELFKRMLGVNQ
jgi:hypothetical protein